MLRERRRHSTKEKWNISKNTNKNRNGKQQEKETAKIVERQNKMMKMMKTKKVDGEKIRNQARTTQRGAIRRVGARRKREGEEGERGGGVKEKERSSY